MHTFPRFTSGRGAASARGAFTLIELLVVISIIAVLAGLLLPVVSSVMNNAKKTSAKSTEMQIVAAVNNFQTEYGVYPVPTASIPGSASSPQDKYYGDSAAPSGTGSNQELFNVLRATETTTPVMNTRQIVYFEGKNAKNPTQPKDGFATQAGTTTSGTASAPYVAGDLLDPWGWVYKVGIDTNYNNVVGNPYNGYSDNNANDTTNGYVIRFGVIAWSVGTNGIRGATVPDTDDTVSWQ